ncbi:MAG TPA: hypothetical protein VMV83_06025 [Rectinemataceae bacterium]|nr:hypothetical protein [Rectinemataceae bacterium]
MKHAKNVASALLASLVLFASCSGVFVGAGRQATSATGNVSIAIPAVSGTLNQLLAKYESTNRGIASTSKSLASRAFVAASRVELSWYKSDGSLDHYSTVYPNAVISNPGVATTITTESMAPGDYTVYAWVWNDSNSWYTVYSPGVSFTVTDGQNTPVNLVLLPYSYQSMTGYYTSSTSAYAWTQTFPWVMSTTSSGVQSFGNEDWFQFTASSQSLYTTVTVEPDATYASAAQPFLLAFDGNGNFISAAQPDASSVTSVTLPTTVGYNYYVVVLDFGSVTASNRQMRIWYQDGQVTQSSTITDIGIWNDYVLMTANDTKTFQTQANVPYLVGWNDGYYLGGDGTKDLDIMVTVEHQDSTIFSDVMTGNFLSYWDSAFDFDGSYAGSKAPAVTIKPTTDESIKLFVTPYSSGTTGTYALKIVPKAIHNSQFSLPGFNTTNGMVYYDAAAVSSYLNSPSGDYLPGWKYELDGNAAATNGGARIDMWQGHVGMAGGVNYQGSSGWGMAMTQDGIMYTTTDTSNLSLSFQINSFNAGGFWSPYWEAPLKVWLKFGGMWHLLTGFTNLYNAWDYGKGYIPLYTTQNVFVPVANVSTIDGYYLYPGTVIQGVKLEANGWYWDVAVNSAALADSPTVSVELNVH